MPPLFKLMPLMLLLPAPRPRTPLLMLRPPVPETAPYSESVPLPSAAAGELSTMAELIVCDPLKEFKSAVPPTSACMVRVLPESV